MKHPEGTLPIFKNIDTLGILDGVDDNMLWSCSTGVEQGMNAAAARVGVRFPPRRLMPRTHPLPVLQDALDKSIPQMARIHI